MKEERFRRLMTAVDADLLEEAQLSVPRRSYKPILAGAAAACLCLAAAGLWAGRQPPQQPALKADDAADAPMSAPAADFIANPIHAATEAEVIDLGYRLALPEGASNAEYTLIDDGSGETPLAQADFTYDGAAYTLRTLRSGASTDISGLYADWAVALEWRSGELTLHLNEGDDMGWIGWYDGETQWCLSTVGTSDAPLVDTAHSIMAVLGFNVDVAPSGAENTAYGVEPRDGLAVAWCAFDLNGIRWTYSTASTGEVSLPFQDISGQPDYAATEDAEVRWCPAVVSYDPGGTGKITWFDVVPGLLYSLTADSGASRDALLDMATALFVPAQGEG